MPTSLTFTTRFVRGSDGEHHMPALPLPPRRAGITAWHSPDIAMVGWGEAARFEATGPSRFAEASAWWRSLTDGAEIDGQGDHRAAGPICFGSFAFSDDSISASVLVVPQILYVATPEGLWVTTATSPALPTPELSADPATAPDPLRAPTHVQVEEGATDEDDYLDIVAQCVERIRAGEARKVVLARDIHLTADEPLDERAIVSRFAQANAQAWTFCVDGLIGATPEMLADSDAGRLSMRVLAGSWPTDAGEESAVHALTSSGKDRDEHDIAVDSVRSALATAGVSVPEPSEPTVLRLPHVVHLATDMEMELPDGVTSLDAAAAVHPTAAVGGDPQDIALAMIAELENSDRGRYAAPVGWMNASGDGQWALALRLIQRDQDDPRTARAFAGGGIMDRSDPQSELRETRAKLAAALAAVVG